MSSKLLVFAVPFRAFARRLRLVTSIRQPLQVVEAVVVARHDVIAIGADSVASFGVQLSFASSMCASLDGGASGGPVVRQSQAPVACVPVHPVARHAHAPYPYPHTPWPVPCRCAATRSIRAGDAGLGCCGRSPMFGHRRCCSGNCADGVASGGGDARRMPGGPVPCPRSSVSAACPGRNPAMHGSRRRTPREPSGR